MTQTPRATLIVTTYEMPRHLELVFSALERQTTRDYEIILCDDGSGLETQRLVENFKRRSPVGFRHLWQENKGFRKCRILNEALRHAQGETMIFLDGDCVPQRDYVHDHLSHQEPGRYLAGRRVELGPEFSEWLTPGRVRAGVLDKPSVKLAMSCWRGDSQHLQRTYRVSWEPLRRLLGMERIDDLKGCNYSLPRKALEELNGFDEAYEGYGREDTDVEIRLQNLGYKIKSLKGLALQYHVWHPRREFTPSNDSRLEETRKIKRIRAELGAWPAR